jgi:hypothetical protein
MKAQQSNSVSPIAIEDGVPLKHRSNCPTAKQFYEHLKLYDYSPIVRALLKERACKTEKRALELIDAWMQWFSVGATSLTKSFVMIEGPVDQVFHQMILNTPWYFDFCLRTTGVYTHHDPLTDEQRASPLIHGAISSTLDLLTRTYGADLHPELKRWLRLHARGELTPASVSCAGNGGPFDIKRN